VTAFNFRLARISTVLAGTIVHPLEDLPSVAAFIRDFNANSARRRFTLADDAQSPGKRGPA
jgi:hypothetical protein